ncbi:MAG: SpoIIE family protein phosphatase [Nocardioidaceae bacterium]
MLVRQPGQPCQLGEPGILCGACDDVELEEADLHLNVGDTLVLYTDDVTEAESSASSFGMDGGHGHGGDSRQQVRRLTDRSLGDRGGRPGERPTGPGHLRVLEGEERSVGRQEPVSAARASAWSSVRGCQEPQLVNRRHTTVLTDEAPRHPQQNFLLAIHRAQLIGIHGAPPTCARRRYTHCHPA